MSGLNRRLERTRRIEHLHGEASDISEIRGWLMLEVVQDRAEARDRELGRDCEKVRARE